jgi:WD40 repeat protein
MGVVVWDYARHQERSHVTGFRAAFSPDGSQLATGDDTNSWGIVHLLNMRGELLFAMTGRQGYVHTLAWSPDSTRLATASVDDTVRVCDASRGTLIRRTAEQVCTGHGMEP